MVTTRAGKPKLVNSSRAPDSAPLVSPNGDRQLFLGHARGGNRVYTKSAKGSSSVLLQPDLVNTVLSMDWR